VDDGRAWFGVESSSTGWNSCRASTFCLRVDALSLLFITLSSFLWLITTVYAIAYFRGSENLSRFFGFFNLCVFATTGIALSGSLITFFVFYEL
jgi:multicomponent Na+:H+ antiporter subunit D